MMILYGLLAINRADVLLLKSVGAAAAAARERETELCRPIRAWRRRMSSDKLLRMLLCVRCHKPNYSTHNGWFASKRTQDRRIEQVETVTLCHLRSSYYRSTS
jgi:hypothetical protein